MRYCEKCNTPLEDSEAAFCPNCGAALAYSDPEQEFLDTTHRLLRWERKAWSITGKAYIIVGIIYAALFALIGIIFLMIGDYETAFLGGSYFGSGLFLGGIFIGFGIVGRINANKIVRYLDTMHYDFRETEKRVGSVGMIVLNFLFNTIGGIFCVINFCRIKACKERIQKIYARQNLK